MSDVSNLGPSESSADNAPIFPTKVYTLESAAGAMTVSRTVIAEAMRDNRMAYRKIGRRSVLMGQDLLDFLETYKVKSRVEIEAMAEKHGRRTKAGAR